MTPLMPSVAMGTNMYCPSQGTHGAASATLSCECEPGEAEDHGGNNTRDSPPASDHGAANLDYDGPDRPHSQQSSSPPPHPPPSPQPLSSLISPSMLELPPSTSNALGDVPTSHVADSQASASCTSTTHTTSATLVSTASKCKQSALHASQSNTLSSKKQHTTTGAVVLNGIKESLDTFNRM